MKDDLIRQVYDELRSGRHVSIGDSLWESISSHQSELEDYFSRIGIELVVASDHGYAYFGGDKQLINLKKARRVVGVLNLILLNLKEYGRENDLEPFIQGTISVSLEDLNLHSVGRFSRALKQLDLPDDEAVIKSINSMDNLGFYKIENRRIRLTKASRRIFEYTMSIELADVTEEE